MEKESLIKVGVLSLVILAIAIPILTTCMAGLQKDGHGEAYDVEVKGEAGPDTSSDNLPISARDMVEYAKKIGATSWTVKYDMWNVSEISLYKGSRVLEQIVYTGYDEETGTTTEGGQGGKFVYNNGYAEIWYYSAYPYLRLSNGATILGHSFEIHNEGKNTTIKVFDSGSECIYTDTVQMKHAWIPAGRTVEGEFTYFEQWEYVYLCWYAPENYRPKFIDLDDIHWFGMFDGKLVYLHGDELIGYENGNVVKGTVEYTYTEDEDTPVKTLTSIHMEYRGYTKDLNEESYDGEWRGFCTITPAHLVYKEPYVGPTLGAMLSVIPIVALAGIGIYVFHKFRETSE